MADELRDWRMPDSLPRTAMTGRFVRIEPLEPRHAASLYATMDGHDENWRYLPYGPFDSDGMAAWVDWASGQRDPLFFALCEPDRGDAVGVASFLRIEPAHGCAEVGHINFSPALKGTPAATEAMALMMRRVFEAGYRRYEWKCDAANLASRRAAQRLGFSFEGVFFQHRVIKQRNRDTAWFAVLDSDWPQLSAGFETWLAPANLSADGRQKTRLSDMTLPLVRKLDPALQTF